MSVWIAATSPASGRGGRPWSSPSSSQGITARTPDQFARKSVHNGRNPANTITSHSPKATADQGLGSSSRKTLYYPRAGAGAIIQVRIADHFDLIAGTST